jgi:hypothetical protein
MEGMSDRENVLGSALKITGSREREVSAQDGAEGRI